MPDLGNTRRKLKITIGILLVAGALLSGLNAFFLVVSALMWLVIAFACLASGEFWYKDGRQHFVVSLWYFLLELVWSDNPGEPSFNIIIRSGSGIWQLATTPPPFS